MDYKKDLAKKLPELKKIEGFPIGNDEDILALSEPPFFTACPNPYINDFLLPSKVDDNYRCEPFVGDVSEGKTDPVYMAHTYHTKVPYKAIIKYIEHYTKPGDVIFDGFSGSGMTAVAAKVSGRNCIISDLSPVAAFMGSTISGSFNVSEFINEFDEILIAIEKEFHWLYETTHDKVKGIINYIVWSEVLSCSFCDNEFTFWSKAYSKEKGTLLSKFECSACKALLSKTLCNQVKEEYFDDFVQKNTTRLKQIPVLINYKVGKKTFYKEPDDLDRLLFEKIEKYQITNWLPTQEYLFKPGKWGDMWRAGVHFGITNTHHFFTKSSLIIFARIFELANKAKHKLPITYTITSFLTKTGSKLHNIGFKDGKINLAGAQPNSLYVPSLFAERNLFLLASGKLKDTSKAFEHLESHNNSVIYTQTCSATNTNLKSNSIDYIFTDPPFGENLMYSEMNFIWEAWLKVFTNNKPEAIINNSQNKDINSYFELMLSSFQEYYRVLKPNRWITVVFHNSKSSVWNALQNALSKAGFIISQVSILDKQQGTKNQMIASGAVEKDLVISAFKPTIDFEQKTEISKGQNIEHIFIKEFLDNQPIRPVIERTEKMLYSKLIAFYLQKGFEVQMDAKLFYALLKNNFIESNGFWFNTNQVETFKEFKKKQKLDSIEEIGSGLMMLFITDEKSSIIWLYGFLEDAKSFSEIHSTYTQLANIQGDTVPELRVLLEQNFIFEDGKYRRPKTEPEHNMIAEKRERVLMKEFESLLVFAQTEKKKIKDVRKEALMMGFETCYKNKRFQDILTIAKKLDKSILENSGELTDFVEAADIALHGVS